MRDGADGNVRSIAEHPLELLRSGRWTPIELAAAGIRWIAVTAIARDGQMSGPDLDLLEAVRVAVPGAAIIAPAGVNSPADIRELAARGVDAAIIGRALYEGALTLPEALEAARTA
jgi:phosphoribosylformimino-5-aminoimidazole carboxamide ribonucleotide (ProFAR) isomerase